MSCKDVATIGCLLNRPCIIVFSSSKGLIPYFVSIRISFHKPEISRTSTVRPCVSCKDVATIGCLLNRTCLLPASPSKGRIPHFVSIRISFHKPEIIRTSTVRIRVSCKDVATIRGLLNRTCIITRSSTIGHIPHFVSIQIGFHKPEIITASTARLCASCNDVPVVRCLLDRICIITRSSSKRLAPCHFRSRFSTRHARECKQ